VAPAAERQAISQGLPMYSDLLSASLEHALNELPPDGLRRLWQLLASA